MKDRFTVDGNVLTAHISSPTHEITRENPGVVIAHEFPTRTGSGTNSTVRMPVFADLIATETGFAAMAFASRGMNGCEGNFSLDGWRRDLKGAIDLLVDKTGCHDIWIIGFGIGGSLGIQVAVTDSRIRGVATVAAPADFDYWARNPRKLLVWGREVGVVHDLDFPDSLDHWASQLRDFKTAESAKRLNDKALLVLHGNEDDIVPLLDARVIASTYSESELHVIKGAGHHLRHDPRAMAILLGWLERQRKYLHGRGN